MRYILLILLVAISFIAKGQRPSNLPVPNAPSGYYKIGWIRSDSGLIAPNLSDTGLYLPAFPFTTIGRRTASDTSLYFWTGLRWKQVGSGSSSGVTWGDITGALSNQTDLQNALNLKLNISDTSSMLSPYLRKIDTTAKWVTSAFRRSDSVFMVKGGVEIFAYKDSVGGGAGATNISVQQQIYNTKINSSTGTGDSIGIALNTRSGVMAPVMSDIGPYFQNAINLLPEIKLYQAAQGVAATTTVANYPFGSVDSVLYYLSTTQAGSAGTEYGGVLFPNKTGDSVQVRLPYWVVFGDSQAEGHPGLHGRLDANGTSAFQYNYPDSPGQISYAMRALTNMRWYNQGIGGNTTSQMRQRFYRDVVAATGTYNAAPAAAAPLTYKPQGVVIIGGINDVANGVDFQTIKDNLEWMASVCQAEGIRCVILNLPGDAVTNQTFLRGIQTINTWLASGALDQYGACIVDYNKWWNDPAYGYDNIHHTSLIVDDIHPSKAGYDSLAAYIFRAARLPKLTKAVFINELSPTTPVAGYFRPHDIMINNTAYTIDASTDTIAINSFLADSSWIRIVTSDSISVGSPAKSGFSTILFYVDNNVGDTLRFTKRTLYSGSTKAQQSISTLKIIANNNNSSYPVIDVRLNDNTNRAFQLYADNGGGGYAILNGLTNTARLNTSMLSIYASGATAIGTNGNIIASGTSHQFGNLQLRNAAAATTSGYGISTAGTGYQFWLNTSAGANLSHYLFDYWNTTIGTLGSTASGVTRNIKINLGFANAGNTDQRGFVIDMTPTYNVTTSFGASTQITGLRYVPTLTSLTGTLHRATNFATGHNYFNSVSDNFGIGVDSNTTLGSKLHVNGTVRFDGMLAGSAASPLLVKDADSIVRQVAQSSLTGVPNIYNANGTLTGNRTLTGSTNTLTFTGLSAFNLYSSDFTFAKNDGTFPYLARVSGLLGSAFGMGYLKGGSYDATLRIDTNNNVVVGSNFSTLLPLYATGHSFYASAGFISGAGNFYKVRDISADENVLITDNWINIDATGGNVTLTLANANTLFGGSVGIRYVFKRQDASGNTVTIQVAGGSGNTIDGATSFTIVGQYTVKEVQCISSSTFAIK